MNTKKAILISLIFFGYTTAYATPITPGADGVSNDVNQEIIATFKDTVSPPRIAFNQSPTATGAGTYTTNQLLGSISVSLPTLPGGETRTRRIAFMDKAGAVTFTGPDGNSCYLDLFKGPERFAIPSSFDTTGSRPIENAESYSLRFTSDCTVVPGQYKATVHAVTYFM
ncbi:hypothetical protein FAP59_19140 [Morganella morganii]|nr:hypothetical protein [Morganella morganii]